MPRFRYQACDATGARHEGMVEAADAAAAQVQLATRSLRIDSLVPEQPGFASPAEALSAAEASQLALHLVELTKAGVPLASGLESLAAELPRGRLARTLDRIGKQLALGVPVEAALDAATRRLPPHVRGMLAAGMQSGKISELLEGVLIQQRDSRELSRQVWLVMSYPLLLLSVLVTWVLFIFEYLVPQMRSVYEDFDVSYSKSTEIIFALSKVSLSSLVVLTFVVLTVIALAIRIVAGPPMLSRLINAVPLLGPLRRYRHLADYCSLLALLLDQQIPLPAALELAASGGHDAFVAQASRRAAARVVDGASLSQAIARLPAFPITLQPLVQWGENQSLLSAGLQAGAQFFRRRMELQSALLMRIVPPLIFVAILLTVLLVTFGLLSPLLRLITDLSG